MSAADPSTAPRGENKMGTMPIPRLLLSMSLPMMASMLVQALYNIVDSIFVARISEAALTSVSLAFPAQALMIAVCTGTGVGMNAFLSKSLGEKKYETVDRIAGNGFFLAVVSFLFFCAVGALFTRPFFESQTGITEIVEGGVVYLRIVMCASLGLTIDILGSRMLQATGRTSLSMAVQMTGAVINMILDPIMIFGLCGFPAMGIAGAAVATVTGQSLAACLAVWLNLRRNRDITFSLRQIRPDSAIIRRVYAVGLPSIVMASVGSVMVYGLNRILIGFTPTAAAVLGIYFKLQSFAFLPVFGLNNGMVPIISYNYGARRPDRMIEAVKTGTKFAFMIMLSAFAVFQLFARDLFGFFDASPEMLEIGVPALRIISTHFLLAGFCICTISTCQSLGHGIWSLAASFVRQIVVLLPAAYLLSLVFGLDGIWWSYMIAELASFAMCLFLMRMIFTRDIRALMERDA